MRTALLLSLLLLAPAASADPTSCPAGFVLQSFTRPDGTTVRECTFVIHGDVARPYPFNVSGRSPIGWTPYEAPRSFVAAVSHPLRRAPF